MAEFAVWVWWVLGLADFWGWGEFGVVGVGPRFASFAGFGVFEGFAEAFTGGLGPSEGVEDGLFAPFVGGFCGTSNPVGADLGDGVSGEGDECGLDGGEVVRLPIPIPLPVAIPIALGETVWFLVLVKWF